MSREGLSEVGGDRGIVVGSPVLREEKIRETPRKVQRDTGRVDKVTRTFFEEVVPPPMVEEWDERAEVTEQGDLGREG